MCQVISHQPSQILLWQLLKSAPNIHGYFQSIVGSFIVRFPFGDKTKRPFRDLNVDSKRTAGAEESKMRLDVAVYCPHSNAEKDVLSNPYACNFPRRCFYVRLSRAVRLAFSPERIVLRFVQIVNRRNRRLAYAESTKNRLSRKMRQSSARFSLPTQ